MKASDWRASEHAANDLLPACPRCGDLLDAGATTCPTCSNRSRWSQERRPLRVIHVPAVDDGDNAA